MGFLTFDLGGEMLGSLEWNLGSQSWSLLTLFQPLDLRMQGECPTHSFLTKLFQVSELHVKESIKLLEDVALKVERNSLYHVIEKL